MSKKRIIELEQLITKHKALYYQGRAEISDEKYDQLEDELRKLDPENPTLKLVGIDVGTNEKINHSKKMLSLEKTYDLNDVEKFLLAGDLISVFKIDGSSCSMIYKEGKLEIGKTRGDGEKGENITEKIKYISDIPKRIDLNGEVEIRGEIFCDTSGFSLISKAMQGLGLDTPSSLRNIVAGLLGRKEHISLSSHLRFIAFDLIGPKFETEEDKLKIIKKNGFQIPDFVIHKDKKGLQARIDEAKEFMASGDYLIDGVVFVYNDIKMHEELGETSHHPRYKLAYKFQGDTKTTKILDITWQVSRNGRLTPVAEIEPTELSGATISRVTLHNFGQVKAFNLKPGDEIEIVRSGEVIPKFLSVVKASPNKWSRPNLCPSCGSELVEDGIWLLCNSTACPAKQLESILHWIKQVNIEDLSDKRLLEMIDKKLVTKIPDLYRLNESDLLQLDKVKEKLAQKIITNIQKTKHLNLVTFLSALGLEGISKTKAEKIIMAGYDTIESILKVSASNLIEIEGFAEKSAQDIVKSIEIRKALISELIKSGITIEKSQIVKDGALAGLKFCITGALSAPRSEIENLIKMNGGALVSSVSKNTNYLVTNEVDSQSSKYIKAKSLNVPIINEAELTKMFR